MSTATGREATADVEQDGRSGDVRRRRWFPFGRSGRRAHKRARRDRRRNAKAGKGKAAAPEIRPARRRRWPWIVALVTVLALLGGCVYAVFFSSLLAVKAVSISGVDDALTAQVRSVVSVPSGTPLARVDLGAVAATVQNVPEVADVEVAREWPDTLAITVTPRVPIAVTSANGQLWLLDSDGDPYLTVASPPPGMVTVQLAAPGRNDPATRAALSVVHALTPDFTSQVAVLSARTEFDVELTLIDRRKVIWGEPVDNSKKMQMLPALLAARDGTEYDITDPTLATVR
jgi:cell division protein FtsQ